MTPGAVPGDPLYRCALTGGTPAPTLTLPQPSSGFWGGAAGAVVLSVQGWEGLSAGKEDFGSLSPTLQDVGRQQRRVRRLAQEPAVVQIPLDLQEHQVPGHSSRVPSLGTI